VTQSAVTLVLRVVHQVRQVEVDLRPAQAVARVAVAVVAEAVQVVLRQDLIIRDESEKLIQMLVIKRRR